MFSNTANTGVYVFEPGVFDLIPPDTFYGFGNDVFPRLLAEGKPLYGYLTTAYWKDVGNLQVYRQTNFDALNGRVHVDIPLTRGRRRRLGGRGRPGRPDGRDHRARRSRQQRHRRGRGQTAGQRHRRRRLRHRAERHPQRHDPVGRGARQRGHAVGALRRRHERPGAVQRRHLRRQRRGPDPAHDGEDVTAECNRSRATLVYLAPVSYTLLIHALKGTARSGATRHGTLVPRG